MSRLSIPQYVMALAHVAALRSEDPYRKVGAAALDKDNRVIGTAYNGLFPGFKAPDGFWTSRQDRQKYMLHAEINLCSLFKRGEAHIVACTTMPCTSCMQALCAHGVKTIYYGEGYADSQAPAIAAMYGVELIQVVDYPLAHDFPLVPGQLPKPTISCNGEDGARRIPMTNPTLRPTRDRLRGCLMGLMCGDALGAPLVFKTDREVASRYPQGVQDMVNGWQQTANLKAGDVTDDSEMALTLLRSLHHCKGYCARDAAAAYQDWLRSGCADVGATIAAALGGTPQPDSQANGALMRIAPLAIFSLLYPDVAWETAAQEDAQITHMNDKCAHANIIYTESLRLALLGVSRADILATAEWRAGILGDAALLARLKAARSSEPTYTPHVGWVEIAFQAAYYYLLHAEDYTGGVTAVANRLGDSDTNAAIVGALLGARFGESAIPEAWRRLVLCGNPQRPARFRAQEGMQLLDELLDEAGL